ncbi:MAG: ATP-dependent DNA helicase RecG, partial [Clostridia bacterium]|nr:ATP-dependent DNA helicase RecG [Clostridia bacterium]
WCFLMAAPNERLNALVRTSDGFEIAQEDLRQRGPGDLMGVRQHGQTLPPGMKEGFDIGMITEAADELNLLKAPGSKPDYAMVRAEALRRYEQWLSQITMN